MFKTPELRIPTLTPKLEEKVENQEIITHKGIQFRLLHPHETKLLHQAVRINNQMWGPKLTTDLVTFKARAENGILLAAIKDNQLIGSITAMLTPKQTISQINIPSFWANTWDGITANGTLAYHDPNGEVLICVAISVHQDRPKEKKPKNPSKEIIRRQLTQDSLQEYLESNNDYVLRWHKRPKGGYEQGAKICAVIPNGRPADTGSLGYNILMKYPDLISKPVMSEDRDSVADFLIEAAMLYAYNCGIKEVYPYSRPAQLSQYFYLVK